MTTQTTESVNVREIVRAKMDEEEQRLAVYRIVRAALARWEGKVINRKLHDLVKKALLDAGFEAAVWYGREYGHLRLSVFGRNLPGAQDYNRRLLLEVPEPDTEDGTRPRFSLAAFEERNRSYGPAAEERQDQRRAFLAAQWPEEVERMAQEYLAARSTLHTAISQTPDGYAIAEVVKARERYL